MAVALIYLFIFFCEDVNKCNIFMSISKCDFNRGVPQGFEQTAFIIFEYLD